MSSKEMLDELNKLMKCYDPNDRHEKILRAVALYLDNKFAKIEARLKQLEEGK